MTDPNVLFTTLVKPALPIFLLVGGLYLVRFVYRRFKSSFKGSLGETLVTQGTFRLLDKEVYRGFSDLYVPRPDGDGLTQVDHVVVSPFGIFVIETKNYTGWIYGAEHQAKWTQTFGSGGKFSFQNPIWQNKLHLRAGAAEVCDRHEPDELHHGHRGGAAAAGGGGGGECGAGESGEGDEQARGEAGAPDGDEEACEGAGVRRS
jgi:hypothetical protein